MKKSSNSTLIAVAALTMISGAVIAGGGGSEFNQVHESLSGWANGTLGKTLAVASLLVGLGIGVVKQSVMAAAVGVSTALVAGYGPEVIGIVIQNGVAITNHI